MKISEIDKISSAIPIKITDEDKEWLIEKLKEIKAMMPEIRKVTKLLMHTQHEDDAFDLLAKLEKWENE